MQQGDVAPKAHIENVCFWCFRGMLQVFCTGVAKVDLNVTHVAMAMHVCFKMFHLYQTYGASIFIWMLQK
jgi:hypothetical protein